MLKRVLEVPNTRKHAEQVAAPDVREFLRKRYDAAIIELEGRKPDAIAKSANSYLRKHKVKGVTAMVRSGVCYLVRDKPVTSATETPYCGD